ncbi:MFS transporter [Vagococcus penaei]|uniref:MFS transporter n=1 Tax=Vagococcus penaei TaxID=633807 RepID=A0A1Q2D3X3_9ENTE|nr:MFS transporter [Vagococcus penaei]AQP53068.1 MFS transporter [Vagococcus penaei]RSU06068.1 MFS transporter [Vagococcus penaei]
MENQVTEFKHKWFALTILALSVSLVVIDGTIVNVSLPVIMKDLKLTFTNAEWIITLYSLIFSTLLITMGRIADHIGRRKTLITGIIIFSIGSIMASFSTNVVLMLVARSIQGIGGATVLPTTLSAVNSLFFGKDRITAFAVWGSVISGMAAIGPLLGGFFTTYLTWHWIFWINIPIGIFIIIGALKVLPETYGQKMTNGFDFIGFILSTVSLGLLIFGIIEGRNYGWWKPKGDHWTIGNLSAIPYMLGVGAIILVLFLVWERHLNKANKSHLLDISLFRFKSFSLGNMIAGVVAIGESGLLFLLPLFLQNILLLSPIKSGVILAMMGVGAFIAGGLASFIVQKTSAAFVVSLGLFLETLGFFGFFKTVSPTSSLNWIIFWLIVYGIGLGFASAQLTSIVLKDVPPKESGQGSSVQSTIRQIGSALGIAIIGTIFVMQLQTDVPHSLDNLNLPSEVQKPLEKSVVESAGSSIKALKEANPETMHITKEEQTKIVSKLDDTFTRSVVKTIGIASGVMLISLLLTIGLYQKKPDSKKKASTSAK